jgi:hypothetical protein
VKAIFTGTFLFCSYLLSPTVNKKSAGGIRKETGGRGKSPASVIKPASGLFLALKVKGLLFGSPPKTAPLHTVLSGTEI